MTGSDRTAQELSALEREWARAIVDNNPGAIGQYMADEWTIVGADGSVCDKETFLGLVASGQLTHDLMEFDDVSVRSFGEGAVVTSRAVSRGRYQGQAFDERERTCDVFVRRGGEWKCVLTHLAPIAPPVPAPPPEAPRPKTAPAFRGVIPEFPVPDIDAALEYYRTVLGFSVCSRHENDRREVVFGSVLRGQANIYLSRSVSPVSAQRCWVFVDEVDDLCRSFRARGAHIAIEPADMPWKYRQFTVKDPDGHLLNFFRFSDGVD